ncbi:MAG TPA: DUF2845 domain-containing protein [Mizugakiibacter sp.]
MLRIRKWCLAGALCLAMSAAAASGTVRFGNRVIAVGDSATRVLDIAGKPDYVEPVENVFGAARGERWQYRVGDKVVTITIADGKVVRIEESEH